MRRTERHFEAKLVEQEHRWIRVIQNYLRFRNEPPESPLRQASRNAMVWRILSPANAAAVGVGAIGGLTAFATLLTAFLLMQQNEKLDQQTHLAEASRSSALVAELGLILGEVAREANQTCAIFENSKKCWPTLNDAEKLRLQEYQVAKERGQLTKEQKALNVQGDLSRISTTNPVLHLSVETSGRVRALASGLRPYRFILIEPTTNSPELCSLETMLQSFRCHLGRLFEQDSKSAPVLSAAPLSRERGLLLKELLANSVAAGGGVDLRRSLARGLKIFGPLVSSYSLVYSDLDCSHFTGSLNMQSYANTSLRYTSFNGAIVKKVIFDGADLTGANFEGAELGTLYQFRPRTLRGASFHKSCISQPEHLQKLVGIDGFSLGQWKIEPNTESGRLRCEYMVLSTDPNHFSGGEAGTDRRPGACASLLNE